MEAAFEKELNRKIIHFQNMDKLHTVLDIIVH